MISDHDIRHTVASADAAVQATTSLGSAGENDSVFMVLNGGGGRTRTYEAMRRLIYSQIFHKKRLELGSNELSNL